MALLSVYQLQNFLILDHLWGVGYVKGLPLTSVEGVEKIDNLHGVRNNLACKAGVFCSGNDDTILGNSALQIDKELGKAINNSRERTTGLK